MQNRRLPFETKMVPATYYFLDGRLGVIADEGLDGFDNSFRHNRTYSFVVGP